MAHIAIRNLTVEFKIYGSSTRSLKRKILSQATGGLISHGNDNVITVKAIDNISLDICDGDRVGLLGHNGAGKTTLLRTIAGIYKPSGGVIEIDGTVGALLDPAAGLDLEATGRENIYLRGYVLGMTRREINEQIAAIAEFAELGRLSRTAGQDLFDRHVFAPRLSRSRLRSSRTSCSSTKRSVPATRASRSRQSRGRTRRSAGRG